MSKHVVWYLFLGSAALLLVGFLVGLHVEQSRFLAFFKQIRPIRNAGNEYHFTVPFLGTDAPEATDLGFLTDTNAQILHAAGDAQQAGGLQKYGVYFKSLNSPIWFGINEDENFLPASLYKLPIALVVYREIEDGKLSGGKRLTYTRAVMAENQAGASDTSLKLGSAYTVDELLRAMLSQSDNGAKNLLGDALDSSYVTALWSVMNLGSPHPDEEISARDYSFFFRVLYNSTYLNADDSEAVLGMMASSTYSKGLVAGVPSDVAVSHKWGRYNLENGVIELHDCGIIYDTEHPYLLCVMTEGASEDALAAFISRVSSILYSNHNEY